MKKPRPLVSHLDEISITRASDVATIHYKDPDYGTTHLTLGPEIAQMTDQDIMEVYNATLRAQSELAAANPYIANEVPLNSPQIEYHEVSDQWTPRGNVLRCLIDDNVDGEREPVIEIDGTELSLIEFGKLLCTYAGWGMRIEFVPDDETHRRPKLLVREPES